MQQVKVKDIRHIHSKPDAPKKWHLVALVDAEDQEYTTFDLAVVDVGIGGVIEFDVEMKRGKAKCFAIARNAILMASSVPILITEESFPSFSRMTRPLFLVNTDSLESRQSTSTSSTALRPISISSSLSTMLFIASISVIPLPLYTYI